MILLPESLDAIRSKARAITKKITSLKPTIATALGVDFNLGLSAELDAAIKVILDDSFLKVIDRAFVALDSTIDKTSQEFRQLVQQIFDNLSDLERQLEQVIEKFFQNISNTIQDIQRNITDPLLDKISKLEEQIFQDLNQVLDKVFNYFDGKHEEFKQDLLRIFTLPNPLDPCRQKYKLELTPGHQLMYIDVFNLFECHQLKRLNDGSTTVREIKEIYAILQFQAFRMTCLGRGAPNLQELYIKKWLDYGQLFKMWKEFNENMTPLEAYEEAIRKLNQARAEYQAKIADIDLAQQTANDAVNRANSAQNTANDAVNRANNALNVANNAMQVKDRIVSQNGRFTLVMQNDDNLVIYGPDGSMWASRDDIKDKIRSQDGRFTLIMQNDDNLVIYGPNGVKWALR